MNKKALKLESIEPNIELSIVSNLEHSLWCAIDKDTETNIMSSLEPRLVSNIYWSLKRSIAKRRFNNEEESSEARKHQALH
jgi:hypothetical protein